VRIFGRREAKRERRRVFTEGSVARLYYDLIDDQKERRERKGVIYTTVRLLDPQSSTDS
jgi:hypothetical protein